MAGERGPPLGHAYRLSVGVVPKAFGVDATNEAGEAVPQPMFGTGRVFNDHDGT